jgi:excinuclease ABC subunit C
MNNIPEIPEIDESHETPLARGRQIILDFAKMLPLSPGVYRMINTKGEPLYIGKARQLQRRVLSYTNTEKLPLRLQRMIAETVQMEVIHTHTEAEALMLEANMIRKFLPRYNVLLRDDKSIPYILVTGDHDFPQLVSHRGVKSRAGNYFGPFASAEPVWRTINSLQRVFQLRNCTDNVFAQRKRPCLQYHIKRCTAPCVGKVTREAYAEQVQGACQFLQGKTSEVQHVFADKMQQASAKMDYEMAATYRDRIKALTSIQSKQDVNVEGILDDVDVIAGFLENGQACVQIFFFRGGRNYGNKAYFPRHDRDVGLDEILSAFIGQFYQSRPSAPEILINATLEDQDVLAEMLSKENNFVTTIHMPQRGDKKRLMDMALDNAKQAHARNMADTHKHRLMLEQLADLVGLDSTPERLEVYDNSHLSGTNPLGVMIVVGTEGFEKKQYRKFNIKGMMAAGDDYAMLDEVLTRRLSALLELEEEMVQSIPDLLVIDGGKGQLSTAQKVLQTLGLTIPVIAIAKGPNRHAGKEEIHFTDKDPIHLPHTDPLLYFLQRIRDEAHRFVITGQRQKRTKDLTQSRLDSIPGIGAKRKKALLLHFGSAKAVERAGIEDLCNVEGISAHIAELIYNYFNQ